MTRAIIFDIDGTLVDSVDLHAECWAEALRHVHIDVTVEQMRREIGKGADQLLPEFMPGEKLASERERIAACRAELFKTKYLSRVTAFAGVPDLFQRIRADGRRIVLASSSDAKEVGAYAKIAGITDLVDVTTSADDAESSKPDPDIFAAALAKVSPITAANAMVIGDATWDIIAAKKAGIAAVGLTCGAFSAAELREAGAVATYRDPADLLANYAASPLAG